ncbi:RagB/SusD family nutrient uptake outer membrane protein [Pontixanthobacter gangjinensis]|uniref:RagB/SusD family nutrient uptake outer membrane protein n=1 Tax=Christiangramia aestuarii TaxID=1028746 RepID=A0A7K1LSA2_9FLAO|nr:RagB/SusD family nutrient uptake outer membrane protein [Christiangramia aestuarii]MUP43695.1 RagB/SusD family nutrient uptake outer membrane protein [Christiangramia aestuarii]
MKTKLYSIKWIVAIAFLALSGCSDDFVYVDSPDENSETYFNTPEEYDLALVGAYDLLQSTYLNVMLGEIASDNTLAGGESATDVPGIQEIDDMEHTPVNQQLRDIWSWMFAGVNRANYILEFQDKIDFEGKNEIIAQARFLRAYYYFELVKWFGDVPLAVDRRIQFGEQFNIPRTPKSEVYALIEEDLIFASANLPATQAQEGRITSGAAQALLGKAYLYQNKFAEAATAFEPVINGPYSLVEDYNSIFEPEGENNSESIFEVQYTDKEGAGFGCLQCSEGNVAVGFNGIRNYSGPVFESGFSFNVPVQEVVDVFTEDDIRKDVAILDIEAWAAETGATYAEGYEHTGYYNRKYIARQGDLNTGDANLTNPNNYRAIRLADVLLMAAEANYKKASSDEEKARQYLNRVRERAGLEEVSLSGSSLLNQIYEDRRLELVGEGHRFFDLVRTGRAAEEIDGFQTGKHELFPIPAIEIELAGNIWEQNPGY